MERAHSGFVQPQSTPKRPICEEERSLQTLQPAADSSPTSPNQHSEEFNIIETNISENEPEFDVSPTNSDVKVSIIQTLRKAHHGLDDTY